MARKSTQKMKSEVGSSRDAKIASLVAIELTNEEILAALEATDNTIWDAKDPRRTKNTPPYDKIKRQRAMEAIRSVRHKVMGDDENFSHMSEGAGGVESIADVAFANISRFSSGMEAIDNIFGKTEFVHLTGPNKGKKTGHIEIGMPKSFITIIAGSPGVGKTRLAIALTKSLNKQGKKVLYFNGEAERSQFRSWCGVDVNPKLFLIKTADCMRLEDVVADILTHKPEVVIVDSLQMILAIGGILAVISRFKLLKNDPDAGCPHFILISQLNKKGELKGSTILEHLVDCSIKAIKIEGRQGQFLLECPRKNRGGPTPVSATFRHTEAGTVETVKYDKHVDHMDLRQTGIATGPPLPSESVSTRRPFVPDNGDAAGTNNSQALAATSTV